MFEKDALSKYYTIVHLKENEYLEYKYRKQKFLLDLDYQTLKETSKDKILTLFKKILQKVSAKTPSVGWRLIALR